MAFYKGTHFVSAFDLVDARHLLDAHKLANETYAEGTAAKQRAALGVEFYEKEVVRLNAKSKDRRQRDPMQQEAAGRENQGYD